jgi:hypothetical protein
MGAPTELSRSDAMQLGMFLFVVPFLLLFALVQVWPRQTSTVVGAAVAVTQAKAAKEIVLAEEEAAKKAATPLDSFAKRKADAETAVKDAEGRLQRLLGEKGAPVGGWLDSEPDIRMLLLVMIAAAIGSSIHAAKVYAFRQGNRNQEDSWVPWYFMRFPTGIGIALIFYLVIRGGVLADQNATVNALNPFGITAISALAGMFSLQASRKLEEIFEGIFRTAPKPPAKLEIRKPKEIKAQGAETVVTLEATGARAETVVLVDNVEREAFDETDKALSFKLTAAEATLPAGQTAKELKIVARNPGPPVVTSNSVMLRLAP